MMKKDGVKLKIITTSRMSNSKLYVPKKIKELLEIKDGDVVVWFLKDNKEIILKNSILSKDTDDFIDY